MSEVNRRDFLAAAIGVACAHCLASTLFAEEATGGTVDVGPLSNYSKDGVNTSFAKSQQMFIVTNAGRVMAISSMCTHKKKLLEWKGDEYVCPAHGSHFNVEGSVTKKPATRSLVHYAISVDDKKHVIVDTTKSFSEKDWEDPASFVNAT